MEFIPQDKVLRTKPDTLEFVRKQYELEKPGKMKEAINILRDWVQKQNHFKKKDFSEYYYEVSIITCKGYLERAKKRFDRMCTLRTLLPQFFGSYNVKTDFGDLYDNVYVCALPNLNDDHNRLSVIKFHNKPIKSSHFTDMYRYIIVLSEYIKTHDYMNRFEVILDYSDANVGDILKNINLIELRQIVTIYAEGYVMRIGALHVISSSKLLDAIILILKQVLSPKVTGRIHYHKTFEGLHKHIPKSILPKDYGGEERSLKELQSEWKDVLSSEDHLEYLRHISAASTDESLREKDEFNEEYAGMPGTFRVLSVD